MRDLGINATEFWCLPWLDDEGVFQSVAPWPRLSDGRYNLSVPNEEYWDLKLSVIDQAHDRGFLVQLCVHDYYGWAASKQGMLWVPDRNQNPLRLNRNSYRLGDPNDDDGGHFFIGTDSDWVIRAYIAEACRRVPQEGIYWRTANEMAEKPLHQRLYSLIKAERPDAFVICNRQNNNTGQYRNMVINGGMDGIEFHNFETVDYIKTVMPGEQPPTYPQAWAEANPRRVFMSTDGCRNGDITNVGNSYDYGPLGDVLIDHWQRGFNISHQSDRKMVPFIEGAFHFNQWDQELAMLARVKQAIGR